VDEFVDIEINHGKIMNQGGRWHIQRIPMGKSFCDMIPPASASGTMAGVREHRS
jgi:hypothetical protein